MKLLENKVALITGGSRGIGKSIVEKFVSNGCNVAFTFNKSETDAKLIQSNLSEKDIKIKGYKEWIYLFSLLSYKFKIVPIMAKILQGKNVNGIFQK